jgi:hypothetical protein
MGEMHAPAALPQRTRNVRHRFVASRDHDLLASLLSEYIVFLPPSVQSPIPGGEHAIGCRQYRQMAAQWRDAGEIIAFEVMVRPIKALAAPGEETGNRIDPQLSLWKQLAGVPLIFAAF